MRTLLSTAAELTLDVPLMAAVFVIAGILGGIVGYLMNNAKVKWRQSEFLKSVVFGVLISAGSIGALFFLYAELFLPTGESAINLLLAGCLCFLFSVVFLMFAYRFLMRMTSVKRNAADAMESRD